ncbi:MULTISPECIES: BLUF domain-containing protein [unclassified Aureimonas]|uniref:BLUF domain-containing protein n=1 Tax=unclassified Aureimonas TaxID=2615206 RepID=UPI0006F4447B|nr:MULTISPECIES: BLUF domain-containing protein [unclassified Aureimonas]KQT57554.1 blue light sensor protein [Aureimonas sp. Leaf427]KQT77235.1 blue light sensor protein [Aureimonas sp. Leaf460]
MTQILHRLVYYSRNHISCDDGVFGANVDDILAKSRTNNVRDQITGALLFNAGCFAQVLEGPLENIEAAFERIQQDDRHGDVALLALDPISHRSFPNWAMGFVGTSDFDAERFADIGRASGFDPSRLSGDQIHMLLRDLTIEEEAAA